MSPFRVPAQAGLLAIVAVTIFFVSMDAVAKLLTERYEPFFVAWARYAGQAAITLLVFAPRLHLIVRTRNLKLQVLRSAFLFSTTLISFTSVSLMPLAQVVAIAQVTPIYIILLAALVLREGIDRYRWLAVGLGFLGAMIIVRPGTEAFTWAALLPLFGSFVFACYSIATRYLGGSDSVWTTFFYTGLVGACGASLAVPFVWSTPAWADVPLFCLIGALGAGGQMMLIVAMKHVQASVAAPFLYLQLVWAAVYGFFLFDDLPKLTTLFGACFVVAAGLLVRWRALQQARAAASGPTEGA